MPLCRATLHAACGLAILVAFSSTAAAESAWIRVNQVGYLPNDPKIAVLSSDVPLTGQFTIADLTADVGPDQGAWGPFAHNYRLDFSHVRGSGRYRIKVGDVESPEFAIGPDAYRDVPAKLLEFMQLQRCGDNPVTGKKCHQQDGFDTTTGEMVDLVGRLARRRRPAQAHDHHDLLRRGAVSGRTPTTRRVTGRRSSRSSIRHPTSSTCKSATTATTCRPTRSGTTINRTTAAAPADRARPGARPAQPEGPKYKNKSSGLANLAGRSAAAMILAGDVEAAKSLYKLAQSKPGSRHVRAGPRAVLLRREHVTSTTSNGPRPSCTSPPRTSSISRRRDSLRPPGRR